MKDRLPPGFGPVLARGRTTPIAKRLRDAVALALVAAAMCAYYTFRSGRGPQPVFFEAAVVGWILTMIVQFSYRIRAGDGWFATRWWFVRTDRLARVRGWTRTTGFWLRFTDADGRSVRVSMPELTCDDEVWRLVLAGVRVSVANGLVADNPLAARLLGVPLRSDYRPSFMERIAAATARRRARRAAQAAGAPAAVRANRGN